MHRYSRMHLSPDVAMRNLDTIDLEEKTNLAEGIALIAVLDHRKDYLAAGYSCMRDFCMGRLRMSEGRALRRIQVARVALQYPEVFECLADGRLSVATAAVLAAHLTPEPGSDLLAAAAFQSRDEIVRLLATRSRQASATFGAVTDESSVESSSSSLAPGRVNSLSDLCAAPEPEATPGSPVPAHVDNARRGRVSCTATGSYEVRLMLTDDEHENFRQARDLLGHAVPSGDPALVYARAMKHYLAHLEKRRFGVKRVAPGSGDVGRESPAPVKVGEPRNGRGIPKAMRRLIRERDGGSCAFVSADGHRCGSTTRLELDHITPLALGGRTEPENLRLLCRAHNQYEAERVLGKDHVQRKRDFSRLERARAKSAAEASAARAKARDAGKKKAQDAAKQARNDDLRAAPDDLGFTAARVKRGVEIADTMPEASLETCVRHALTGLTRAVVMRGQRRAVCSAWAARTEISWALALLGRRGSRCLGVQPGTRARLPGARPARVAGPAEAPMARICVPARPHAPWRATAGRTERAPVGRPCSKGAVVCAPPQV